MEQNKTGKYLKYAIGEIFLVVIGILIALQIGVWEKQKRNHIKSIHFQNRLINEFELNLAEIDLNINKTKSALDASKTILNLFLVDENIDKTRKLDSLLFIILESNSIIDIMLGTLLEGQNTGIISHIESESIRTKLYGLTAAIEDIRDYDIDAKIDVQDNLIPYLYDNFNYRRMDNSFSPFKEEVGNSIFEKHETKLFDQLKFENLIDNRLFNLKIRIFNYNKLKRKFEELITLIELEK